MINSIVIFRGARKDFDNYLEDHIKSTDNTIPFMDLIQHYNARIRPTEAAVKETDLAQKITVDNCIVRTDDYGSVLEHVLPNFVNILSLNHRIKHLYVQNPPKRVQYALESAFPNDIEYCGSVYQEINREVLKRIYYDLSQNILGQDTCKKQLIAGLYRLISASSSRPSVLMLYGPSGVGKTETAKSLSKSLGGDLLRVQFSMMQTVEAYNYVFGAEHSKTSFARDLLSRETNIILIDEFDKVNPQFYNAFYQLFDEGRFVDSNYEVDMQQSVFILTCNFMTENQIRQSLGPAMFSRIGCCIKYEDLTKQQKEQIIFSWFNDILSNLQDEEKSFITSTNILNWFTNNADRYDNIRILKTKMENAVFEKLTEHFILS